MPALGKVIAEKNNKFGVYLRVFIDTFLSLIIIGKKL
jgi:hypothetical protein